MALAEGARGAQRGLSLSQGITSDSEHQACALSSPRPAKEREDVQKHSHQSGGEDGLKTGSCLAAVPGSLALTDIAKEA